MTPERASEIVTAINDHAFVTMGVSECAGSLKGVSLSEMLEAKATVRAGNEAARAQARRDDGSCKIAVTPDDRLIAAVYCFEHYPCDREPILSLPYVGTLGDRKVLAVLAIDSSDREEDEA